MTHPRATPTARTESTQNAPSAGTDTGRTTPDTALRPLPTLADLRHHLSTHLDPAARAWLEHALDEAAA
ncbi:sugar phosphate isomerase, partial [Streptomyces sp. NPDC006129]